MHASGSKRGRRRDGIINKGVTHKIKKPKIRKIKEKKKNSAKAFLRRTKELQLPLRLPANRSPRKDNKKMMKRVLSSPGISLLDSPETNPEAENERKKIFTSRSKAAATVALSKGIKLSAKDGELSFTNRRTTEKKNIGSQVEKELQNKIKMACSLSVETVSGRLESISKLSSFNNTNNVKGPTRFAAESPKKLPKRLSPKKNWKEQTLRRSPRKSLALKATPENSPQKKSQTVASPRVKAILNGAPTRSPKSKSLALNAPGSPKSSVPHLSPKGTPKKGDLNSLKLSPQTKISVNGSPRRSPRRNLSLITKLRSPSQKSPAKRGESTSADSAVSTSPPNQSHLMTPLSKTIGQIAISDRSPRRSPRRLLQTCGSNPLSPRRKNGGGFSPSKSQNVAVGGAFENDLDLEGISTIISSNSEENDILCSLLTDDSSNENPHCNSLEHLPPISEKDLNDNSLTTDKKDVLTRQSENVKYFSIFNPKRSNASYSKKNSEKKQSKMLAKRSDPSQLILDAGQKDFGAKYCRTCGILYEVGDPDDEIAHQNFHDGLLNSLKYTGWKAEKQVTNFDLQGGRVIKIEPGDSARHWNKVEEVLLYVDKELGFSDSGSFRKDKSMAFLYILDHKICGCLIAEEISQAYEVIQQITSSNTQEKSGKLICCSAQPQKVFAGISRIWVLGTQRRKGIASRLMEAMRSNFFLYHYLKIDEFAFSYPTESGLKFAEKHCRKPNFLVYGKLDLKK